MEQTDFGWAIRQLKSGEKVQRAGWNGKGMYLFLTQQGLLTGEDAPPPSQPFIVMKTADNKLVPWLASQTDVLAEDWSTA